jgi:hypothetical protein
LTHFSGIETHQAAPFVCPTSDRGYRHARQVIAVAVTTSPALQLGARRMLFEGPYPSLGTISRTGFTISPDGKHFALLRQLDQESRLVVTTNWLTELRSTLRAKNR